VARSFVAGFSLATANAIAASSFALSNPAWSGARSCQSWRSGKYGCAALAGSAGFCALRREPDSQERQSNEEAGVAFHAADDIRETAQLSTDEALVFHPTFTCNRLV
jgi:hypothetical protein